MSDQPEEVEQDEGSAIEPPEEPLHGPDGSLDCMDGRYAFVEFWLRKLGIESAEGAAVTFGEGCSLAILHPLTGEWLTPADIVKKAGVATVRRIQ
jgi:hypothetical protein